MDPALISVIVTAIGGAIMVIVKLVSLGIKKKKGGKIDIEDIEDITNSLGLKNV